MLECYLNLNLKSLCRIVAKTSQKTCSQSQITETGHGPGVGRKVAESTQTYIHY